MWVLNTVNTCEFKSAFCWPVWRVVCTGHCMRFGLWINYFRHRVMVTFDKEVLSFPLCRTKRPAWLKLILVFAEWSLRSTYRQCYPSLSGMGCFARRIAWSLYHIIIYTAGLSWRQRTFTLSRAGGWARGKAFWVHEGKLAGFFRESPSPEQAERRSAFTSLCLFQSVCLIYDLQNPHWLF